MLTILIVHNVESFEGDHSSKYKQTHNLMLIYSDALKKAITENSKFLFCVSTEVKLFASH